MYEDVNFELTEAMMTGVEKIDLQHKEILRIASQTVNSIGQKLSDQTIKENLTFLWRYISIHFREEEELQQEVNYPYFQQHKQLHDDFSEEFIDLNIQYNLEGKSQELQDMLHNEIIQWVVNHVINEDSRFAAYYKEQKQNS